MKLGSDPELFVVTDDVDVIRRLGFPDTLVGTVVPGYYALGITDPKNPDIPLPYGEIRPDGLAAEFTLTPSDNIDQLVGYMRANIQRTAELVAETVHGKLSVEPRTYVPQEWIDALPKQFGDACSLQVLGCSPDFSVYNIDAPPKPDPRHYNYRTSGGHIHVEIGPEVAQDGAARAYITAALDTVIGTAGTYLCDSESARRRKELYGQPGMVRVKPAQGILEYRALTAQALIQTPELCHMMFTLVRNTVQYLVDLYQSAPNQSAAIADFRRIIGDYDYLVNHVVQPIMDHDVGECRAIQDTFAQIAPAEMNIQEIVRNMQRYHMPTDFMLRGW